MAQYFWDPSVLVTRHPWPDTILLWSLMPPCSPVNIWIPSVIKETKGGEAYHVYQVYIKVHKEEWNVYRRYSEFRAFHKVVSDRPTPSLAVTPVTALLPCSCNESCPS